MQAPLGPVPPFSVYDALTAISRPFVGPLWFIHVSVLVSALAFQLPSPSLPNFVKMLGFSLGRVTTRTFSSSSHVAVTGFARASISCI